VLAVLSGLAAACCAAASSARLGAAVSPTFLDPGLLASEMSGTDARDFAVALRDRVEREPRCEWERGLLVASFEPDVPKRASLLNEQLTEFDGRVQRFARVPRVCASLSTTCGLLFGTIAVLDGLGGDLSEAWGGVLQGALSSVALGVAGTAFSIAAEIGSRRAVNRRNAEVDRLVARLEACATPANGPS
jgi:hypothetical protein